MKTLAHTILLFLITVSIHGQGLTLKHTNKTKSFDLGHYLSFSASQNGSKDCNNCDLRNYVGKMVSVTSDSITIKMELFHRNLRKDGKDLIVSAWYTPVPELPEFMTVPKSDIYSIENLKSKKHVKRRKVWKAIGGVLTILGAPTMLSAAIAQNKDDSRTLFFVGAAELGAGILLLSTSNPPKYNTWDEWSISRE